MKCGNNDSSSLDCFNQTEESHENKKETKHIEKRSIDFTIIQIHVNGTRKKRKAGQCPVCGLYVWVLDACFTKLH